MSWPTLRKSFAPILILLCCLSAGCGKDDRAAAGQEAKDARTSPEQTGAGSNPRNAPSEPARPSTPAPRAEQPVTVAAGTAVTGTLQQSVSTGKSNIGDPISLRVTEPVVARGVTIVPAGSTVHGTITHVRRAGRMKGASELTLRFTEIETPSGRRRPANFEPMRWRIRGDGKETAAEISGGAAVGGILGGAIGGGDGALKGGAIGAAIGTGVAAATKGEQIELPAGQTLRIQLAAPLTVVS